MKVTKKTVDELIVELQAAELAASVNLEEISYKVRPGRSVAKQNAQLAIPGLIAEVLDATVPGRLVGIFAEGDAAKIDEVSAFLTENNGIVLDAGAFYLDIAQYVEPSYGDTAPKTRTWRTTQFGRLRSALEEKARELGIKLDRNPAYDEVATPDLDSVLSHVRTTIRGAFGDSLNVAALRKAIGAAVVKRNLTNKRIPVLVVNATAAEKQGGLAGLFSKSSSFEFLPDFQTTKEEVVAIFKGK